MNSPLQKAKTRHQAPRVEAPLLRDNRRMQVRFFSLLMAFLLALALTANAKCPVTLVEVRGSVAGTLPAEAKIKVTVFGHKRKNPVTKTFDLDGSNFAQALRFPTLSRSGLLGEWGERCDRSPEQVVIELIDKDGHEIDRALLDARRDVEPGARGITLRAVVLRGER
jgi:hypothetical protein